jgi:hypothetical protein
LYSSCLQNIFVFINLVENWDLLFAGTIGSCCNDCEILSSIAGDYSKRSDDAFFKWSNLDSCCEFSYMKMKILWLWFEDENLCEPTFAMTGALAWQVKKKKIIKNNILLFLRKIARELLGIFLWCVVCVIFFFICFRFSLLLYHASRRHK